MDKTLEIAAWLYRNNSEFTNLKTDEARLLMDGTMAMAHIFLHANGQGEFMPEPLHAGNGRIFLPRLEGRWNSLCSIKEEFDGDLLHSLKTVLRRFSYATPAGLMESLIKADPFCHYANGSEPVPISDDEIPADFIKSMQLIKQQYADFDFDYKVIKIQGRNFFAETNFELRSGEYDEVARAINEGLIEDGLLFRISRNNVGDLMVW